MSLEDLDRRFREAMIAIPPDMRPTILRILSLHSEERAAVIGVIYQEGLMPSLAELLMDLEEEPTLRRWIMAELRRLVRQG